MNMHKNARMTPLGRDHLVRAVAGRRRRPPHMPQASARGRPANGLAASRRRGERV